MEALTQDHLDALERAIATGVTRVQYQDRVVNYASLADMMRRRQFLRQQLGLDKRKPERKTMAVDKGLG